MGRHFEVRAAAMAATAKAKSAIYMRASREIYAAAKSGEPDPNSNLALRAAIEKYRKQCPKDVIDRAIERRRRRRLYPGPLRIPWPKRLKHRRRHPYRQRQPRPRHRAHHLHP